MRPKQTPNVRTTTGRVGAGAGVGGAAGEAAGKAVKARTKSCAPNQFNGKVPLALHASVDATQKFSHFIITPTKPGTRQEQKPEELL